MAFASQLGRPRTRRTTLALLLAACYPLLAGAGETAGGEGAAAEAPQAEEAATPNKVEVLARRQNYRGLSATGATKTDTLLKDLPQSVRVITTDLLKDVGVTDLAGALDLSSGISRASNFGGQWDSYAMRGFTGDPNFGSDYMVNGFNSSRGYNGLRDGVSTQTVEVLKGPASALYGRGEPGGTVNITTKKPRFGPSYTVELSGGSFDTYRGAVDLTGPLSDTVAYRLSGAYEKGNSFRDTLYHERTFLSPSFIWLAGDNTTVSYELEAMEQRAPFDRGVLAVNGKLGAIANSTFLGEPGDGPTVIKSLGHQIFVQHQFNDGWSLQTGLSYRDSSLQKTSTEANNLLADGRTLRRQHRRNDFSATDVSGRVEVLGKFMTGPIKHSILVGVDAYRFEDHRIQDRRNPSAANAYAIDIYNPVYGGTALPMTPSFNTQNDQSAHGFYGQDQVDLTEQWKLLAGLRYDRATQTAGNNLLRVSTRQEPTATSPRAGLVYQPTSAISLYVTAAKGFRPNSGISIENTSFAPEKSKSYEAGAKMDNGALTGTLAVYKITKENVLTTNPLNTDFSIAAGEVGSKGVELDLSGEIYPNVRLSAAYAYTDATVTKGDKTIITGSRFPNVPKQSASIVLTPSFKIGSATATLGGGVSYVGERLGDVAVSSQFMLPAYTTFRLLSSYSPNKKLRISLNVDNLFNKQYYASSYSQLWVQPGTDRSATLNVRYTF
ncbi:TonB-dependent siderophore receptor [Rugamonas sp. FT82W]|uniref:TonB-dependent siderophore receptor n=1 Tax=Duganella vulcania TaxID=2692166 RepID=A0A845GDG5_9BURK|nr:TonB-dependent siderophore receptor [Duganella vulcania]MYM91226.1 TonB-dependent siderophore receptor [Duganella vulcania]